MHGRLDVLVNNAATNPYFGPITETDPAIFQKTVDVNIRGYFYMSSHGAKLMAQHGGGSIINIASVNGVVPGFQQGIYSITKAAVISMTKAFAVECAEAGVRCNALLPGLTDTKFASVLVNTPAILQQALAHVPMRRVAQPAEMAGAALYLVGTVGVTMAYNVPRNNALAELDPQHPDTAARWSEYVSSWTAGNSVRAACALLAAAAFIVALLL